MGSLRRRWKQLDAGPAAFLFLSMGLANVGHFGFHLLVSRALHPAQYGAFGALLGVMLVMGVPATALQLAVTKAVAQGRSPGDSGRVVPLVVGPLLGNALIWGLGAAAVLLAASPLVRIVLHLPSTVPAVLLAAYALITAVALVPRGVLLGEVRFRRVGVSHLVGASTRIALGLVAVRLGLGLEGAMGAVLLGEAVAAATLLPALRQFVASPEGSAPLTVRASHALFSVSAVAALWILTSIDTVTARHFLPRVPSGWYVAAATAASAALFVQAGVTSVVFPVFAATRGRGERARKALLGALASILVLSFGAATVLTVAARFVVATLFGPEYAAASGVLGILAFTAAFLAALNVLTQFHLASERHGAAMLGWASIAIFALVAGASHGSLRAIATAAFLSIASMTVLSLVVALSAGGDEGIGPDELEHVIELASVADRDLTLVVPFYNPGGRLRVHLEKLVEVLRRNGTTFEIIAVSDGSTDGSEHTIAHLVDADVTTVVLPRNVGKGAALRVGLGRGRGRYVGFIDADGDIDAELLPPFLQLLQAHEPDAIVGSKRHPESKVDYPRVRRLYSWGYQQLTRVLFRLDIRDTQTGLKVVRRDVLAAVLPRLLEKRFAFDLELLVVARHLGYEDFLEAPIVIRHQFSSTVSLSSVKGMLLDTFAIFYRLQVLRSYDDAPATTPVPGDATRSAHAPS